MAEFLNRLRLVRKGHLYTLNSRSFPGCLESFADCEAKESRSLKSYSPPGGAESWRGAVGLSEVGDTPFDDAALIIHLPG